MSGANGVKDSSGNLLDVASQVLDMAKRHGAQQADVMAGRSTDFEVKVADGAIVTLTQATSKGLGLRVFVDGRLGFCSTSDFNAEALEYAVGRAVAMAKEAAPDPHHGLAEVPPGHISDDGPLDLFDPKVLELAADEKIRWAHALEEAARGADPRVRKFRDSGVSTSVYTSVLVTSTGASRASRGTGIALWSTPVAEANGELQTESWYDSQVHLADLEDLQLIGRTAGLRAARMLGAKPVKTQEVPVIFEAPMAAGLLAGVLGALDGDMVYKKASFLSDKLGQSIATSALTLVDDPLLPKGSASTPFDGEGLPTRRKNLIDAGVLTTFLYDSYTARKAKVAPTASARRGYSSQPHAGSFNLYAIPGKLDPAAIAKEVPKALLVTRGLGRGLNTVSGEYSRGANGLWLENGEVVHPVQEVTIAGDYLAMLRSIDAIGNDLRMRGAVGAPTVRIASMTVSGS